MAQPINHRIEKVLNKLLEPDFKPKDNSYLNLLLTHLTTKSSDNQDAFYRQDTNISLFIKWMKTAVLYWEQTKIINVDTLTFTLNLMSYFSKDEQVFLRMNDDNIYERFFAVISGRQEPSIQLAFMKLNSSFLKHASGVHWIVSKEVWKSIVQSCLNPSTIYISKEGFDFMTDLIEVSMQHNAIEALKILKSILKPLLNASAAQHNGNIDTTVEPEEKYHTMLPLLTRMFEKCLKNANQRNVKEIVMGLENNFKFEEAMIPLMIFREEECFSLHKIFVIWVFLKMFVKYSDDPHTLFQKVKEKLSRVYYDAASRFNIADMLKLLHLSLFYWNEIKSKLQLPPNFRSDSPDEQLLLLQIFPVQVDVYRFTNNLHFHDDRVFNNLRTRIHWRKHLEKAHSFTNGILALKYILHSSKYYIRESAVMAFSILMKLVKDVTNLLKTRPDFIQTFFDQSGFIVLLIQCIQGTLDEFTITPIDSDEYLCILQIMYDLINVNMWPTKIIISCLKLIEKALLKYTTSELVAIEESVMKNIMSILTVKLRDSEWEVRDSAIELICTITKTISANLPSLCTSAMENYFPNSILEMATIDGNSFVRAAALRSLQEMVNMDESWNILVKSDIWERGIRIMQVEQEGIVRTEAAGLIVAIYDKHEIPESVLVQFYDIMHHAVVADLHWETRVNALKFWISVIDKHLSRSGLVKGEFLSVESTKTKYIEALEQLSQTGCLSAFQFAIQDDCDLEVAKYAATAMTDFATILKKNEITAADVASNSQNSESNSSPCSPIPPIPPLGSNHAESIGSAKVVESVMDDVLDSLDANLLESIFNSRDEPQVDNIEMQCRRVVAPKEFLESIYADLVGRVKQKSIWIEGIDNFDSLLDDILKEYEVNDVNEMDCY